MTDLDATIFGPAGYDDEVRAFLGHLRIPWVAATGRTARSALGELDRRRLPRPNWLACDVGSSVYRLTPDGVHRDEEWAARPTNFDPVRLAELIEPFDLEEQGLQSPRKLSFFAGPAQAAEIESALPAGLAEVIFSHGEYLDLIPIGSTKGDAARWIAATYGIGPHETIGIGDSGNDAGLLRLVGMPAVVANADGDLLRSVEGREDVFRCTHEFGLGVIEATEHYRGVLAGEAS